MDTTLSSISAATLSSGLVHVHQHTLSQQANVEALDSCPPHIKAHHWQELTVGSGISPNIASINFCSLEGEDVFELLAEHRLDSVSGEGQQYVTAAVKRILKTYESSAQGGWRDCGLDPLQNFAPAAYGRFKADHPRIPRKQLKSGEWGDSDKPLKYDTPVGVPFRITFPRLTIRVGCAIAKAIGDETGYLKRFSPQQLQSSLVEEDTRFWPWYLAHQTAPVTLTEGTKKAAALLSAGIAALALPGITMWHLKGQDTLHPDLAVICTPKRPMTIAFDQDEKPTTVQKVGIQIQKLGETLQDQQCRVTVAVWPSDWGKGVDDVLVAKGESWLSLCIQAALQLEDYRRNFRVTQTLKTIERLNTLSFPIERQSQGEYLPPLPSLSPSTIHVVDATMNTGKTYRIGRDWVQPALANDQHVLVLSPLNSLGQQTAQDWGIEHIHNQGKTGGEQRQFWNDLQKRPAIVLCPDSIAKLPEWFWAKPVLLVIDEGNQVSEHICQGDTLKGRYAAVLERIQSAARHAIHSGGAIVLSEDGIPDRAVQFWQAISGAKAVRCFQHRKRFQHSKQGQPWQVQVMTGSVAGFRAKLLKQVEDEETRFLFVTSSQREAKRLDCIAQQLGRKVVRIDGETNQNGAFNLFFQNPDQWLQVNQPEILILSPSAKSGVSIEGNVRVEDAYFTQVWGYFPSLSTDTHLQLLGRYRPSVPRFLFLPALIQGSSEERLHGPRSIRKRLQANISDIARIFDLSAGKQDLSNLETAIFNYLSAARAVSGAQKSIPQTALIKRLEQAGHQVTSHQVQRHLATSKLWNQTQDQIWQAEAQEMAQIVLEDFQTPAWAHRTLDSMEASLSDRKAAYKVLWRDQFPGVTFDDAVMCYEALCKEYGKLRRGVLLQARAENLEAVKADDQAIAEAILNGSIRAAHRFPKNYIKAAMIAELGILELLDGNSWCNSDSRAIAIKAKALQYAEPISYWLQLHVKPRQTPSEICNKLVGRLGVNVVSTSRPGPQGSKRDRVYGIENLHNPIRAQLLKAARAKLSESMSSFSNKDLDLSMENSDIPKNPPDSKALEETEWWPGAIATWVKREVLVLIESIDGAIATIGDDAGQYFQVPIDELVRRL